MVVVGTPSEWSRESSEAAAPDIGTHEARRDAAEAEAHRPTTRTTRGDLCAVCRRVCGLLRLCEGDPREPTASAYVVKELNTAAVIEFVPKYSFSRSFMDTVT